MTVFPSIQFTGFGSLEGSTMQQGNAFRGALMGDGGIARQMSVFLHRDYGVDLRSIEFQFHILPDSYERNSIHTITPYAKSLRQICVSIIVEEEFFAMSEPKRVAWIKQKLLWVMPLVEEEVKKRRLDTQIDRLSDEVKIVLE